MAKATVARRYLAATDGSPPSDKAVEHAIVRAREAGVDLIVMMAIEVTNVEQVHAKPGGDLQMYREIEQNAKEVLNKAVDLATKGGVHATSALISTLPSRDVAAAIVLYAEEKGVKHVFVGSHGRTGIMRQMLGSVAERVVKLAHCPVTVVR